MGQYDEKQTTLQSNHLRLYTDGLCRKQHSDPEAGSGWQSTSASYDGYANARPLSDRLASDNNSNDVDNRPDP
ncbi:MAG TPA: hypothetical protein VK249_24320 [Anaerolineales bacterium]|nr:hypothetical protein [Anaerolineales bacterium]